MKYKNTTLLIMCVVVSEFFGSIGSLATIPNIPTWYRTLIKPPLNPPNWIFGPVWSLLFALIGISLYLILSNKGKKKTLHRALFWFSMQFTCNILWSFLFFGFHSPAAGLLCIGALWSSILLTIQYFSKIDRNAGYILIPYLAWVTFALYLNAGILILNS
jgi:tryptophan-rich sensory protein